MCNGYRFAYLAQTPKSLLAKEDHTVILSDWTLKVRALSNFAIQHCYQFIGTLNRIFLKSFEGFFKYSNLSSIFSQISTRTAPEIFSIVNKGHFYSTHFKRCHLAKTKLKLHAGVKKCLSVRNEMAVLCCRWVKGQLISKANQSGRGFSQKTNEWIRFY